MNYITLTDYSDQDDLLKNDIWHYSPIQIDKLSDVISMTAKNVYSALDPGLPKCVYQLNLFNQLAKKGFQLETETSMLNRCAQNEPVRELIIVNQKLVIECIAENAMIDHYQKRIMFDLQNTDNEVGLLINFSAGMQDIAITKVERRPGHQLSSSIMSCNQ